MMVSESDPRHTPYRLCAALLALHSLTACQADLDNTDLALDDPVKILACNPITGSLSFMGPALEKSMELATSEINTNGGILGRPLQLIMADTHSDPEAALAEATFYYQQHPDTALLAGASLDTVSKRLLREIAENVFEYGERIPMVSPASTSFEFVSQLDLRNNLFFRTVCSSHLEGDILADKADRMGLHVGAAVGLKDINNTQLFTAFRTRFQTHGADHQISAFFYEGTGITEVSEALERAFTETQSRQGVPPSFLLVLAYGSDGKVLLTEWAKRHADTPLLIADSLMSDPFLSSLDPATLTALETRTINGVFPGGFSGGHGPKVFSDTFCTQVPRSCRCESDETSCAAGEGLVPEIFTANAYDAIYIAALGLTSAALADENAIRRGQGFSLQRIYDGILSGTNKDSEDDQSILPGQWALALESLKAGVGVNYEGASSSALELDFNGDPENCTFSFWSVSNGRVVFENSEGAPEVVTISLGQP